MSEPHDLEAVIAVAAHAATCAADPVKQDGIHTYLIPEGYRVEQVDYRRLAPRPARCDNTVALDDADSLIAYLQRHADKRTVLYVKGLTIVAVLNDHGPNADPSWRDHRAVCTFEATPAWLRWTKANGSMFDQESFAELVEERLADIAEPAGADLLELAQSLQAHTKANFRSDRRLANGQVQISYVEEVEARAGADGTLTIPSHLTLVLRPFYGAEPVMLRARFRYRLAAGKLTMGVLLNDVEQVRREAVFAEVHRISEALPSVGVLYGTP